MTHKERAALLEAARSGNELLGCNVSDHNLHAQITQASFARDAVRAEGPRLAQPSWHTVAAALAREQQPVETALSAAFAAAIQKLGEGR